MTGRFICFEGIDGSGKSSCLAPIRDYLTSRGLQVRCTREPGGTPIAEQIRELLLREQSEVMDPIAELLLVFAARRQHYVNFIRPQLDQGVWVISDRFIDSSYCYQGLQSSRASIDYLSTLCVDDARPDLTCVFDLPVAVALTRADGGQRDRLEATYQRRLEQIRSGFVELAAAASKRYLVLDAEANSAAIVERIKQRLQCQFGL